MIGPTFIRRAVELGTKPRRGVVRASWGVAILLVLSAGFLACEDQTTAPTGAAEEPALSTAPGPGLSPDLQSSMTATVEAVLEQADMEPEPALRLLDELLEEYTASFSNRTPNSEGE